MKTHKLFYILPIAALIACEPEFDDIEFAPGSADFSNYVSVGNSLTAGFQSNALRRVRQQNSFPAILATQLKNVGAGEFKQPLLDAGVGIGSTLNAEFELAYVTSECSGTSLGPAPSASQGQIDQFNFPAAMIGAQGPFNNVGVPGAKSYHLAAAGYGDPAGLLANPRTANPFYVRFVNPQNVQEPVINQAVAAGPTFFSLWIGNNDVLGYALAGGSGVDHNQTGNVNPATYGGSDITNNNTFASVYNQLIAALTANGAKGVVANIPDITSIPHFNTIPIRVDALTSAQVTALNSAQAYGGYNAGISQAANATLITQAEANERTISFSTSGGAFVIIDTSLTDIPDGQGGTLPKFRQLKSNERLVLTTPQDSLRCAGWGTQKPIPANFALLEDELANIKNAVASYNATIKQAADANGLAFVDANKILSEMESGLTFNGVTYSTEFVSGGAFSLDGVHPNTVGYAIIANAHVDAINAKYGAKIPKVNVNEYEGIVFP